MPIVTLTLKNRYKAQNKDKINAEARFKDMVQARIQILVNFTLNLINKLDQMIDKYKWM